MTDAIATDEPTYCAAITHYGSRNPDSAAFGPDEYCENEAAEDSEYCERHGGNADGDDYDYDDDRGFDYYPDL